MRLRRKPKNSYERVREFHRVFNHPVGLAPSFPSPKKPMDTLRIALIEEELQELKDALANDDIVGVADALGDLEYVVNGAALVWGINLPEVVKEIHRSNMTKLGADGQPIYREDGKILKGEFYEKPNLERVLGLAIQG